MIRALRICLLTAGLMMTGMAARAACRIEALATVPVESPTGHLLVSVAVNGTAETFILDTGAERTLMSDEAVQRLGLARDSWVATTVLGIGGVQERPNALPRSLELGGVPLRRRTLHGDTSVTVGPLFANEIAGRAIAGLLGRDFLSVFDLDLDLPAAGLKLYDVRGCSGAFLPWTTPYAAIPATAPMGNALVVQLAIEGRKMRALLDTGASASLITAPGMFRLGLTPEMMAGDPGGNGRGVGPSAVFMRHHRFSELRIGPEVTTNPMLWVAPVRVVPVADMLLGADWLRTHHVWVSYATRQIFVASR